MYIDVDIILCDSYWSFLCILLIWDGYGLVRVKNIKSLLFFVFDRWGFWNIIVGIYIEIFLRLIIYVLNIVNIFVL